MDVLSQFNWLNNCEIVLLLLASNKSASPYMQTPFAARLLAAAAAADHCPQLQVKFASVCVFVLANIAESNS